MPYPSLNLVTEKDVTRFMSYVEILPYSHPTLKSPCWLWTGAKSRGKGNRKWYGTFRVGKRAVRAHAFAFDVLGGQSLPAGWHRDHRCHFSLCVNPQHLEAVSPEINQLRKMRGKGLTVLPPLVTENPQLHLPLWKDSFESLPRTS